MLLAAKKIAEQFSISSSGYRLIMNINHDGGQEVRYIHMHLVGGLRLGRMLSLPSSSKKNAEARHRLPLLRFLNNIVCN